jgi:hypothetical protein
MYLALHAAAVEAIDAKGADVLARIQWLNFQGVDRKPAFQSERFVSANITEKDIIGEIRGWLQDASGGRVLAFIHRADGAYGLTSESYLLIEKLIDEIFKVRWAQDNLSKAFVEKTILKWCGESFKNEMRSNLSNTLIEQSSKAIRKFTLWAPIAHLDVEAPFIFGPAQIAPMTTEMFDNLEKSSVESAPQQATDIKVHFSKLRQKMQGGAAVVLEIEAEPDYVYEKGLMLSADVVGLLRFFSPASIRYWMVCPNALLGAELIPQSHALLFGDNGSYSSQEKIVPQYIAYWQPSVKDVAAMQNNGLPELGQLVSPSKPNQRADKVLAAAETDEAKARAEDLKQKADARVAALGTQLDTAKADAKPKLDAAAAAKDTAKAAERRKADTAKAANEAKLALEPASIFISRATQKLYVRRNTHKRWPDGGEVFDATIEVPVTIRNPDKPIGTHVFTAMARNEAGLRWTAVTIDNADDANDALDRITIPQDVLDRIAPTALPRSSIIVSDEPLSRETNYRTEFVAVLSNQPQGGFITRRPSTDALVASDNTRADDGFGFFFQRNWNSQSGNARRPGGQDYHWMR